MLHVGRLSIFGLYVQMFTTVAKVRFDFIFLQISNDFLNSFLNLIFISFKEHCQTPRRLFEPHHRLLHGIRRPLPQ